MEQITEESGVHEAWLVQAQECKTSEDLAELYVKLATEYEHDYGTICHAVTAMAIAGAKVMDHSPVGHITGLQASYIMWEFMQAWTDPGRGGPMKLLSYKDILYPQMDHKFDRIISQDTADWLKKEADKNLSGVTEHVSPRVLSRWELLAMGSLPAGWLIEEVPE